jgi:hypothetical protein
MRLSAILFLPLTLMLAGGCTAPTEPAPPAKVVAKPSYAARCDDLRFTQNGATLPVGDGAVALARAPFEMTYVGPGTLPALSLALTDDVNRGLTSQGRTELWGGAGDFMAHAPHDIPMGRMPRLFVDETNRSKFAAMLGADYPALLRREIAANPGMDAVLSLPRAGGGFEPATGGPAMTVRTINSKKIGDLPPVSLHLAYFAVTERIGPPSAPPSAGKELLRLHWGTCQLSFQ